MTLTKKHWYGILAAGVALALGLAGWNIAQARKAEKEQAMIFQLKQLRAAAQIYAKLQKTNAPDLISIVTVKSPGPPIQLRIDRDAKGQPIDPFGNAYQYDKAKGWVQSGTTGYESW
jgi:hypothetical protein